MIHLSETTAFDLVRRLMLLGQNAPSMYLLICDAADIEAVQTDIAAEVAVQLGAKIQALEASGCSIEEMEKATVYVQPPRLLLLILRLWDYRLVEYLDRNVVLLTDGCQLLILVDSAIADRTLATAPNLRNRLADVLFIKPDEALRDFQH